MGGRILAINEGFGYRPILTVKSFNFLPQLNQRPPTTWVYGLQLMSLADNPTLYVSFLRNLYGQKALWSQLAIASDESEEQERAMYPRMPLRLLANEELTLVCAGKDPVAGYYVQFAGSLQRLFTQTDWWQETDPDMA